MNSLQPQPVHGPKGVDQLEAWEAGHLKRDILHQGEVSDRLVGSDFIQLHLGQIARRHPLGESPLRVCRRVANSDPFDPDRLQANAIPREKEGILNRRSELDTRHVTSLTRVQGA